MKPVVFMMCLLGVTLAAPAPDGITNEQAAAHANEALRWMEMYRLFQQQGAAGNPFLPAAGAMVDAAQAQPVNAPPAPAGDVSDEETVPQVGSFGPAATPLNSDEVDDEEEAAPAVAAGAPAEPAAVPDPAAAVVVEAPVDVAPAAPDVSVDVVAAVPAAADVPVAVDVPAAVDAAAAAAAPDAAAAAPDAAAAAPDAAAAAPDAAAAAVDPAAV
ncbi:enamelin [Myripristis murdjan]|uniref:enamelin n=1 Tax=Myripristis murdjan TaxID=586833 RepID=UPI0011761041|nr:testis-specific gene A8 protein-like [Myripristis murdjan]